MLTVFMEENFVLLLVWYGASLERRLLLNAAIRHAGVFDVTRYDCEWGLGG